jgi:MerR family transcriptional regulator, copper efflux regulator
MKIGELAKRAGVGVQTVRYYERRGLLPEPVRTGSGYRDYDDHDLLRLGFILRSKSLGFTLTEIRELLELRVSADRTAEDVRGLAREKVRDVERKMADLGRIRAALTRVMDACHAEGPPEACALMHAVGGAGDFHSSQTEEQDHEHGKSATDAGGAGSAAGVGAGTAVVGGGPL